MKTWRKYRTYKRVTKLWLEYKEAAQNEVSKHDVTLITSKLSAFLDTFQQSYVEFKAAGHEVSLESFYGDCSEVLVSLLDLVDKSVNPYHRAHMHKSHLLLSSCSLVSLYQSSTPVTKVSRDLVSSYWRMFW